MVGCPLAAWKVVLAQGAQEAGECRRRGVQEPLGAEAGLLCTFHVQHGNAAYIWRRMYGS